MSEPELRVHDTPEALAADVVERLLVVLHDVQSSGRTPHVALTGGTIAETIHETLARVAPSSQVDWSDVGLWWGDERFVAPDSEDRNAAQARAALLDHLDGLDPANVHEVPSTADVADVDAAAAAYAETLRGADIGDFDMVMLGLGPDGHVASLFPGFDQLDVDDRDAVGVTGSPKPPPERVSLTFPALNRAREVWFVVSGEGKATAAAAALREGPVSEIPARGVNGREATVWFVDEAAATEIA